MKEYKVYYDIYNDVVMLGKYKTKRDALRELKEAANRIKYELGLDKITFYVYKGTFINKELKL